MLWNYLLSATGLIGLSVAQHAVDLGNNEWTVSDDDKRVHAPGKVPSHVHLDLHAAGVIPEPYEGNGDIELRWVAYSNWTYSTKLRDLKPHASKSCLVFDGLDTFASIELCGVNVGKANNQFRQWTFDITEGLKKCNGSVPNLDIRFESATHVANRIAEQPGHPTWPAGVEGLFEFPNRQFIRKQQSDFGWDWGPAFSPAGIWKPAYLVQFTTPEDLYVLNTDIDIYRQGQINHLPADQSKPWIVNASIDYLGDLPKAASLAIAIKPKGDNSSLLVSRKVDNVTRDNCTITGNVVVPADLPKLWWPTGMGQQNLYDITVAIVDEKNATLATVTKRSGFRTILLNQTPVSKAQRAKGIAPGANWHFEVNSHEFYAKGSNMIPPDAFWPRVTETYIGRLFDAVVAGNQNMLRVWASNIYLPDFIYDLADERGILLWSELQFGDALYPMDDDFLSNVAEEISYNVRRVNHHPSLALWAGGNELENLELPEAYLEDPEHYFTHYLKSFEKLFISLAARLIYDNTHSISYTPSSTNNGYYKIDFSLEVPYIERYQNHTPGEYTGDTDYYNYDSNVAFDQSTYPVDRFSNEFGFHSMPSLQTWKTAINQSDMEFNSTIVKLRNHHYPYSGPEPNATNTDKGMGEMTMAVERYYPVPSKSDPIANFSSWCLATQRFQADFYKSQIEFYRRGSGRPERQLGSLYWQLEDIWQAPSWAGIEYGGRWKALHYTAKQAYEPIIVASFWNQTTGEFNVTVISDLWESAAGRVNLTWYDFKGQRLRGNADMASHARFRVGPLNTTDVIATNLQNLTIPDKKDAILVMSLDGHGRLPNRNQTTHFKHENYFMPTRPKEANLVDPKLSLQYKNSTGKFEVRAEKGISLYTWLDHPYGTLGHFSENNFVLLPGQPKEVGFELVEDKTNGTWLGGVTVESIWDQSHHA